MSVVLLPEGVRGPGSFTSAAFRSSLDARVINVVLTGRDTWGDIGEEAVIALVLEVNTDGDWHHVAGGEMVKGAIQDEDVGWTTDAHIKVSAVDIETPYPDYHVILTCLAPCLCSCAVSFE